MEEKIERGNERKICSINNKTKPERSKHWRKKEGRKQVKKAQLKRRKNPKMAKKKKKIVTQ